jgi:hypothetical protein
MGRDAALSVARIIGDKDVDVVLPDGDTVARTLTRGTVRDPARSDAGGHPRAAPIEGRRRGRADPDRSDPTGIGDAEQHNGPFAYRQGKPKRYLFLTRSSWGRARDLQRQPPLRSPDDARPFGGDCPLLAQREAVRADHADDLAPGGQSALTMGEDVDERAARLAKLPTPRP